MTKEIIQFLHNQSFVIVSTIDKDGTLHSACKGIVKIGPGRKIFLLDLYKGRTYENLRRNPYLSITAVDEHKFIGYCLKGKAELIPEGKLRTQVIKTWEERIISRVTKRVLKNLREEKGHPRHPEVLLPQPQYMIVMRIEEIIDLTPHHIKVI